MNGSRVIVFGSLNLDLVYAVERLPGPGETVLGTDLRRFSGGKGGNQAHAAARSATPGTAVAMVGCVGPDEGGAQLRSALAEAGVDVAALRVGGSPSGTAIIAVDAAGENTIVVIPGANADWPAGLVGSIEVTPADVVVCQLEIPFDIVREVVGHAAGAGARVVLNAAPADVRVAGLLDQVAVLVVNEGEAREIFALESIDAESLAGARGGISCDVVVTLGAAGALIADGGSEPSTVAGFRVDAVDTVGAGDAFVGALAASLASRNALADAVRIGNAAGALTASVNGARDPSLSLEKIRDFVTSYD